MTPIFRKGDKPLIKNISTLMQTTFCPCDSTTNHQAYENSKSLEVCAVFLDISKVFDSMAYRLLFKLKQNAVADSLLKFSRTI